MNRLTEVDLNIVGQVVEISAESIVRERLLELGLAPGRTVRVLRRLPLAGPVIVQAGSLFLALRFDEAAEVWVE